MRSDSALFRDAELSFDELEAEGTQLTVDLQSASPTNLSPREPVSSIISVTLLQEHCMDDPQSENPRPIVTHQEDVLDLQMRSRQPGLLDQQMTNQLAGFDDQQMMMQQGMLDHQKMTSHQGVMPQLMTVHTQGGYQPRKPWPWQHRMPQLPTMNQVQALMGNHYPILGQQPLMRQQTHPTVLQQPIMGQHQPLLGNHHPLINHQHHMMWQQAPPMMFHQATLQHQQSTVFDHFLAGYQHFMMCQGEFHDGPAALCNEPATAHHG